MKKSRKILHLFLAVMLAFSFLTSVVYAVTSTQDGLEAEIITDKEVYKANEEILVTVKVKNTNSFLIKRVSIEGLLPDELTLEKGNELSKQIETLNAGETMELTFTAIKVNEEPSTEEPTTTTAPSTNPPTTGLTESIPTSLPAPGIVTTSAPTLNSTTAPEPLSTQQEDIPQTGDNSGGMIALCSILVLGGIVALFFVLRNRNHTKFNRVISIILCVAMLIPSALGVGFYSAKAVDNRKGFTVTKTITVDGKEFDTSANIFYEKTDESGFSEKEIKQMSEVDNSICDIMQSNDYVNGDNNKKVKILEEQLLKLQKKGLIIKGSIHYDNNLNQFYFKYKNGIAGHIVLTTKNKYDSNSSLLDDVSLSISTIDKQITKKDNITAVSNSEEVRGVLTYGFDSGFDSKAYSAVKKIVEDVNKKGMDTTLLKLPTIEQYKKVFKNQDFICIFEHGLHFATDNTITKNEPTYGFSVMGEISTEETDKHYSGDISSERIGKYIDGDGKSCYFITPDFFNFYYDDNKLEDSIVYLLSCQGFGVDNNYDYEFAQTVTEKCGAKAVIGFHNSVASGYAITVLEAITGYMLQGYTIKEAFDFVSQIYGITDYSYADWLLHNVSLTLSQQKEWLKLKENKENNHATLMLYGDEDANLHIKSGTVSGFVKDGHSNKPIKDVDIEFMINDTSGKFNATTDREGKFSIRLPYDNYSVTFKHSNYNEYSTSIVVDCDEVVVLEPIILMPVIIDGNVTGIVKDTDNKDLQDVLVEVIPKDSTEVIKSVRTNILGNYSIPLPHGEYTLRYSKEGYKTKTIEVNFNEHSLKPVETIILEKMPSFAGGDGTKENPYQVSTPEQLNAVRNDLDAHYIQMNDIDMSGWGNWESIGNAISIWGGAIGGSDYKAPVYTDNYFTGVYDGNNYNISNITLENNKVSVTEDCFGLFAGLKNATIKNLKLNNILYNINKETTDYASYWTNQLCTFSLSVGGIAGRCDSSTISNCSVGGRINVINCSDAYVGGIAGIGDTITNCNSSIEIYINAIKDSRFKKDASIYSGGIVGQTATINSKISYCNSNGNISATAGGFAYCGGISGKHGNIEHCFNYGDVTGSVINQNGYSGFAGISNVGGIVGATSSDNVSYCVNYGNISSCAKTNNKSTTYLTSYAGGIAGYCGYYGSGSINNCYNLNDSISSYKKDKDDNIIPGTLGRIAGYSIKISECYSINTTTLNSSIPAENISTDDINGGSLTKEEIEEKIAQIDFGDIPML